MTLAHDVNRARRHLDGAIDSYEFIERTFYEHLESIGEREKRVLRDAKNSIVYFENQLQKAHAKYFDYQLKKAIKKSN